MLRAMARKSFKKWIEDYRHTGERDIEMPEARARRLQSRREKWRAKKLAEVGLTEETLEQRAEEFHERLKRSDSDTESS
jgi:hypothetical protein